MEKGTATNVPGLSRDGDTWILRARATGISGMKIDKTKRLKGVLSFGQAVMALERLREAANAEAAGSSTRASSASKTVGDWAPLWLEALAVKRQGKIKPVSLETRKQVLLRFVLPFFGDFEDVTSADVEDWKVWLARTRQADGKPYAKEYLHTAWATARTMFAWISVKAGAPSPFSAMRFDVEGTEKKKKEALTQEELSAVIRAAENESPDIRAMLILGLSSGMRFCELSALEWRDVDLGRGYLHIHRSQVKGQVGPPKTESSRRDVYLLPEVVTVLEAHRRWQLTEQVAGLERGLLFPARTGGYRFSNVLTKPLARCCAEAKISKHLTSHCLRVTANNLVRQSGGDAAARAMVGHATSEMTFVYSNVAKEERLRVQEKAFGPSWISGAAPSAGT